MIYTIFLGFLIQEYFCIASIKSHQDLMKMAGDGCDNLLSN